MKRNIFGLIASFTYIFIIIISSKMFGKSEKEASRKYIHIMLSNWWIIAMVFFDTPVFACIGPGVFIIVNYLSYRFNLIKSMERDESEKDGLRNSILCYFFVYFSIFMFWAFKKHRDRTMRDNCNGIWRWNGCSNW